jgi:hypothetical protein
VEGHQRGTSSRTAHDPRRPSLERPSLFAGPDDDTADADGLRGVRILSTLESQERGRGAPSRRPASTRERTPGTPWLLWALVVMGLTSAGVALWWAHARWPGDNPTANALAATAAATVKPSTSAASAVAASAAGASSAVAAVSEAPATGASAVAGTPLAALIENTPPAAGPSVLAIAPVGSPPAAAPMAASNPAQGARTPENTQKSRQTAQAAQADKGEKGEKGDKPEKARKAKTPSKPTDTPPSSRRDRHAHADRDVELLEAVMSHTERRQRP